MNLDSVTKPLKHQQIAQLVVSALEFYGGEAHLDEIMKKVLQLNHQIFERSKTPEAEVRDAIQKYSSDSKKYKYTDLFQSVYGVDAGKGVWRLRDYPKDDINVSLKEYGDSLNKTTSVVQAVPVRLVQRDFRAKLIKKYQSTCPLTGITIPLFLVASHIKPWSKSSDFERQDVDNGILLSVHFDKLFDCGEISFNNEGRILYKSEIIESLVNDNFRLISNQIQVNERMRHYLSWHRDYFNY